VGIRWRLFAASLCVMGVAGCVTTPPLSQATGTDQSEILVRDVVQRVKCELSDAFDSKVEDPNFRWVAGWTAHVDLSLTINDNAGLSPNGSFTQFRKSAINTDAGPNSLPQSKTFPFSFPLASQFFSVSAGANLSGQAVRTETVSFTVALDELKRWRRHEVSLAADPKHAFDPHNCNVAHSIGLTGGLGLKEWVDSALYPVEAGQLQAGIHTAPTGGKGGGGAKGPPAGPAPTVKAASKGDSYRSIYDKVRKYIDDLKRVQKAMNNDTMTIATESQKITTATTDLSKRIKEADDYGATLSAYLRANFAKVDSEVQKLKSDIKNCSAYKKYTDEWLTKADAILRIFPKDRIPQDKAGSDSRSADPDDPADASLEKAFLSFRNDPIGETNNISYVRSFLANSPPAQPGDLYVEGAGECAAKLPQKAEFASSLSKQLPERIDPPVDSMLHSLTFVINMGANVSPSWSLIQWKGPSQSGNLLSATAVRTHQLDIALGPRAGNPAISTDATRLIQNQAVRAIGQ